MRPQRYGRIIRQPKFNGAWNWGDWLIKLMLVALISLGSMEAVSALEDAGIPRCGEMTRRSTATFLVPLGVAFGVACLCAPGLVACPPGLSLVAVLSLASGILTRLLVGAEECYMV